MEILLLLVAILVVFFLTKSEYLDSSDDSAYVETIAVETPDRNQEMIFLTRDYLQKYHKICGYCIETKSIKKFTNKNDVGLWVMEDISYRVQMLPCHNEPFFLLDTEDDSDADQISTMWTEDDSDANEDS